MSRGSAALRRRDSSNWTWKTIPMPICMGALRAVPRLISRTGQQAFSFGGTLFTAR